MIKYKKINIKGTLLSNEQLKDYLEKVAASHTIGKTLKSTYPIPRLIENYRFISEVYKMLNEHVKLDLPIHPAGEWILDNFYIIEENIKNVIKELPLKKYLKFSGVQGNHYDGFARIYILALEIVAYTEGKIEAKIIEDAIKAYQSKRNLNMDEIWNIGLFIDIVLVEQIRENCEKIYASQMQKIKAESIAERLIENKNSEDIRFKSISNRKLTLNDSIKYPFIEHMSYILKKYGKKSLAYYNILKEEVEKLGITVDEAIKKEHFDIALTKVNTGNCIISLKQVSRINFTRIFEKVNTVEEILKKDPAKIYEKMDYKTKEYYRGKIKEISNKTNISETYIAKKALKLAESGEALTKKNHIGYYLIEDDDKLYNELNVKKSTDCKYNLKFKIYLTTIYIISLFIATLIGTYIERQIGNLIISLLAITLSYIPISELVVQTMQYVLGKTIKPKLIPKINFENGVDKENATFVVIPTILNSTERLKELAKNLEVYYLANKSDNLYFAILGDCTQSKTKDTDLDLEIESIGKQIFKELNQKYPSNNDYERFYFMYRERTWNEKESCFLGWERKRGLLKQFNEYVLGKSENKFKVNTMNRIPDAKYVITLDADTNLVLNSAFELIGAMAHILNKPVLNQEKTKVIAGHGILQPRVGIDLRISNKTIFSKIFAGAGGIDSYTNAISDMYQDNFDEGIFTGKGIYDIEVFDTVLSKAIPENTVLSHDLLEGNYLRCGLASDILLMDGYPCKYNSYIARQERWIRGDWQITSWLCKKIKDESGNVQANPLNKISKYKIFDNLRRSLLELGIILQLLLLAVLKINYNIDVWWIVLLMIITSISPSILEFLDYIICKKEGQERQISFTPQITGLKGAFLRGIINLSSLPYRAYISTKAIIKTLYRTNVSHKHLLEWVTSEDAEKSSKTTITSYYSNMFVNIVIGALAIYISLINKSNMMYILIFILGILWCLSPLILWYISREKNRKDIREKLDEGEKIYLLTIAKDTWKYFEEYMNERNNYLPPDNYQEDRKTKIVNRTSSTNIGLGILTIVSACDLGFIKFEKAIELIKNNIKTIESLQKWNGHLYNWYNINNLRPLEPRYVSTVDSGNFIGYLYTLKGYLLSKTSDPEGLIKIEEIKDILKRIDKIIDETDFRYLYSKEHGLFSIGFNVNENKLTDSYYDLLASEARQASLIAIAKKNVSQKHWNNLSRTMTVLNRRKGLVSWSGTAFEYLMPNINIPVIEGSLIDESCKFVIMNQREYSRRLKIPWGISEAAFNVRDLNGNYQYKAFGIPWLGLKRGLGDEVVVSSYASLLAITDYPKEVLSNIRELQKEEMLGKYGLYESIDYTASRVKYKERSSVVRTFMAHHQALILLSINNFMNDNIFQKRFMENPEIKAVEILLQERMPETAIITKERKEKIEKLKYKEYDNYALKVIKNIDTEKVNANVISNNAEYTIVTDDKGNSFSKYKDIYVNKYKITSELKQGVNFYIRDTQNNKIYQTLYNNEKRDEYEVHFAPDKSEFIKICGDVKIVNSITIATNEPVEIRRLELKNIGKTEKKFDIISVFEPMICRKEQEYAHPAFNNLFLKFDFDEQTKSIIVKRNEKEDKEAEMYLGVHLLSGISNIEYEINKEKFIGRANFGIPNGVLKDYNFSNSIGLVTDPIIALKTNANIMPNKSFTLDLIITVGNSRDEVIGNIKEYINMQKIQNIFDISRARMEAEARYLNISGNDILNYQKIMTYLLIHNPDRSKYLSKLPKRQYIQSGLWKFGISGDLPILLVTIKNTNDIYVLNEILKAYEFIRTTNINIDLVIIDEEDYSYEQCLNSEIDSAIANNNMLYLKNISGGISVINKNNISKEDFELLMFRANLILDTNKGSLDTILEDGYTV